MTENYVDDRKHDIRCEKAKSKTCHCGCKGKYHGEKSGIKAEWTPSKKQQKIHNDGRKDQDVLYEGKRSWNKNEYGGDKRDWSVTVNNIDLDPRNDLVNHSPDGFNWGYFGSGPSQLALAILSDFKGDEFALRNYQDFKADIISTWQNNQWKLTGKEIKQWIHKRQVE
jgi:hypothetical protein